MRGADVEFDNSSPRYCSNISFIRENSVAPLKSIYFSQTIRPIAMTILALFCVLRVVTVTSAKSDEVEKRIKQLNDKSSYTRFNAANRLGELKDPRAVEPLIEALKDTDRDVRRAAVVALGKIKDDRAAGPLIAAMIGSDWFLHSDAANAFLQLGEIRDPQAIESLVAVLKYYYYSDNIHVLQKAVACLGGIGAPAVEPLLVAMKDSDANLKADVADTLSKSKDSRIAEPIIAGYKDADAKFQSHAVEALVSVGTPAVALLIDALKDTNLHKYAAEALVSIGTPVVAPLSAALKDSDVKVRTYAAFTLGEIKDQHAVEPLIEALKDAEADVRTNASWALGEIKDRRSVEFLIAALKDEDPRVRGTAAYGLGQIKDPRAIEPLIAALSDTKADVRVGASWSLGETKDPRAIESLIVALQDKDPAVRGNAAVGLGQIDDPRAIEPLIASFKDTDAKVRGHAAWALGQFKSSKAVVLLIVALKETDPQVRQGASAALVTTGSPAVEPLMTSLKNSDPQFQQRAVATLASIGPPADEPLVAALNSADPDVRRIAANVLSRAGVVLVDAKTLALINSLGPDLVFYTWKEHPLLRLSDIKNPDVEFGVFEFSPRMLKLRQLLGTASVAGASSSPAASGGQSFGGTGVQFGEGGSIRPMGDTSMRSGNVTLTGIGEDAFGTLFPRHPWLRLFVVPKGTVAVSPIETTGGGIRVRFVGSGVAEPSRAPVEPNQPAAKAPDAEVPLNSQPEDQDSFGPHAEAEEWTVDQESKAAPTSGGPPETQALVYVYRRQHLPPPALYISIFVNHVDLGNLNNNSYVQLSVPTGKAAVIATHADDRDSLRRATSTFPECADLLSDACVVAVREAYDATTAISKPELVFRICQIRTYGKGFDGKILYNAEDLQTCNIFWGRAAATLRNTLARKPLEIEVEAGKTYYVKWSVHSFTGVKMEVVDAKTGAKELKGLPLAK
jgi:HEAT repeat protein